RAGRGRPRGRGGTPSREGGGQWAHALGEERQYGRVLEVGGHVHVPRQRRVLPHLDAEPEAAGLAGVAVEAAGPVGEREAGAGGDGGDVGAVPAEVGHEYDVGAGPGDGGEVAGQGQV